MSAGDSPRKECFPGVAPVEVAAACAGFVSTGEENAGVKGVVTDTGLRVGNGGVGLEMISSGAGAKTGATLLLSTVGRIVLTGALGALAGGVGMVACPSN